MAEKKHKCRYCGAMTTQPDSECFKAPKNIPKIKKEISFTGSAALHEDNSIFIYIELNDGFGTETKVLNLTENEIIGIKKLMNFCNID